VTASIEGLVKPAPSWAWRIGVLLISYGTFYAARTWLTPWVQGQFFGWQSELAPGPKLLVGHVLAWQLAHTIIVALLMLALVRFDVLVGPKWPAIGPALKWGVITGVAISAVTAGIWFFAGPGFMVDLNLWKMTGNLFSNFYEELGYRGLLFGSALYAFRRFWPAAILSGLAFGLSHTQYPMVFRLFTTFVGVTWAWAYLRTRTLLAPWVSHQVSDMLLDTFLKT